MKQLPMVREIKDGERLMISASCPLGMANYFHLVASASAITFIKTYTKWRENPEIELSFPIQSAVWMTEGIFRLLAPQTEGGVAGDVFAVEQEFDALRLRIRRSFNCDGPGELGFTFFRCRHVPGREWAGFPRFVLSDRLLFNSGFYPALRQLAIEVARSHQLPEPLSATATLRPLWMGSSPADTPPPETEE